MSDNEEPVSRSSSPDQPADGESGTQDSITVDIGAIVDSVQAARAAAASAGSGTAAPPSTAMRSMTRQSSTTFTNRVEPMNPPDSPAEPAPEVEKARGSRAVPTIAGLVAAAPTGKESAGELKGRMQANVNRMAVRLQAHEGTISHLDKAVGSVGAQVSVVAGTVNTLLSKFQVTEQQVNAIKVAQDADAAERAQILSSIRGLIARFEGGAESSTHADGPNLKRARRESPSRERTPAMEELYADTAPTSFDPQPLATEHQSGATSAPQPPIGWQVPVSTTSGMPAQPAQGWSANAAPAQNDTVGTAVGHSPVTQNVPEHIWSPQTQPPQESRAHLRVQAQVAPPPMEQFVPPPQAQFVPPPQTQFQMPSHAQLPPPPPNQLPPPPQAQFQSLVQAQFPPSSPAQFAPAPQAQFSAAPQPINMTDLAMGRPNAIQPRQSYASSGPTLAPRRNGQAGGHLAWVSLGPIAGLGSHVNELNRNYEDAMSALQHRDKNAYLYARRSTRRGARLCRDMSHVAGAFIDIDMAIKFRDAWNQSMPGRSTGVTAEIVAEPSQFTDQPVRGHPYLISVRSWNIHGFLYKYVYDRDPRLNLDDYDLNIFQETHLTPEQEATLDLPDGYECLVISRPASTMHKQGGGLAAIYKTGVFAKIELVNALCKDDIMVLDVGFATLVSAYIAPVRSPWAKRAEVHPLNQLAETLITADALDQNIILVGDLNARTKSNQPKDIDPKRMSADTELDGHEKTIMDILRAANMYFLNGTEGLHESSGRPTSFNSHEDDSSLSVVDYVAVNATGNCAVLDVRVLDRLQASDHAPLVLDVVADGKYLVGLPSTEGTPRRGKRSRDPPTLPMDSALDKVFANLIEEARESTHESRIHALYGDIYHETRETAIYTDGSCHNNGREDATAGAGVYFGRGDKRNLAVRVPGEQTNNRGEAFAILCALSLCDPGRSLVIYSDSMWAIASLTWWAPAREAVGWSNPNGDILRACVRWLRARTAATRFVHVAAHKGNVANEAADGLANEGARKPVEPLFVPRDPPALPDVDELGAPLPGLKVSTSMASPGDPMGPPVKPKRPKWEQGRADGKLHHNGRALKVVKRSEKLEKILSTCQFNKEFWEAWKGAMDPRKKQPQVELGALARTFEVRMNPPAVVPAGFIQSARVHAQYLSANLESVAPRIEPDDTFSRPFTAEDIAAQKAKLKADGRKGSPGLDGVAKQLIMNVDNELGLATLFNDCIAERAAPSVWLRTAVIGILKRGLDPTLAASYRTIGLESVILKMLTLLIHTRLYDWAERRNILPKSQNGFRHNFRTNNNVFILRTIIEKARHAKKPVYVAFVDISNAFPSADRDILWLALREWGCIGPIIDWLRMLYEEMRYVVRLQGEVSDEFASAIGVLIGDPSSPTLWNLFIADFDPPAHADDPVLINTRISHLEHADDMLLLSHSAEGLQEHLNYLQQYAGRKQLVIHAMKSKVMLFGEYPDVPPALWLGDKQLRYVAWAVYVGVYICSTERNILAMHYREYAKYARTAANRILSANAVVGVVLPEVLRTLWFARVDCHTSSAADICPDIDTEVERLVAVQHDFLRRAMQLNTHSAVIPLHTEMNVPPIRYRRANLCIRYLRHLLDVPSHRLVRVALQESLTMFDAGVPCWAGDLNFALRSLPLPVALPPVHKLFEKGAADALAKKVDRSLREYITRQIATSSRLYLLRDRLTPQPKGPPRVVSMLLREYLKVRNPKNRKALARLVASDHPFALQRFRHSDTAFRNGVKKLYVPREHRTCRLCSASVESPEHALLICAATESLVAARVDFLVQVAHLWPEFEPPLDDDDALGALRGLLAEKKVLNVLGAFTHKVFGLFQAVELVWPEEYIEYK